MLQSLRFQSWIIIQNMFFNIPQVWVLNTFKIVGFFGFVFLTKCPRGLSY